MEFWGKNHVPLRMNHNNFGQHFADTYKSNEIPMAVATLESWIAYLTFASMPNYLVKQF